MTLKDFVAWLQGYYGQIPGGQKEDLVEYLRPLAPSYLAALKDAVKKHFSSQYGKVPDIAVFEECKQDALVKQKEIHDARPQGLLEAPPERGEGQLMELDWERFFRDAAERMAQKVPR